ncbi:hypothetical protein J1N09_13925 [Aureitalea sp. L0-47]|uniref:hypothetical protein n=1 Tax=Aureitalea sp. L0-47 TaxID=2816962 RepID=UPI00223907FB|nr:hypothetical protein [Aureitalea sp. L0-47]MCW5520943.1 hypothetical protein [Aureitalea sp. L0-47]
MKKVSILIALIAFCAIPFTTSAQTCSTVLKSKNGTVYSANPATIITTATSNQAVVKISKTGGRAETQVNIYVNNVMQPNPIEFDNGNYTRTKTRTLNNVSGKQIKVQIVNQSVANTFKYSAKIEGKSSNITTSGDKSTGRLMGQTNKTIYTKASCTGKARIIVRRTNGKARGNIRVWQKNGSSWSLMNNHTYTFEKNQDKKIFVVNSNKKLKVELRNVSVGNTLSYVMNALAAN